MTKADWIRWALQPRPGPLSHRLVLVAIANRADDVGECVVPSRQLVEETGLGPKTISRASAALTKAGVVRKKQQRRGPNKYSLVH
jgi:hypothetical protein